MQYETTYTVKTKKENYPCMKHHLFSDMVVLFTEPKTGTCLRQGNSSHKIGTVRNDWVEHEFKQEIEELTISKVQ